MSMQIQEAKAWLELAAKDYVLPDSDVRTALDLAAKLMEREKLVQEVIAALDAYDKSGDGRKLVGVFEAVRKLAEWKGGA